jgi:glycosyltransferase involved in cell wall biosynthesis
VPHPADSSGRPIALIAHEAVLASGANRCFFDLAVGMTARRIPVIAVCPAEGTLRRALDEAAVPSSVLRKFANVDQPMIDPRPLGWPGDAVEVAYRVWYSLRLARFLRASGAELVHVNTLIGVSAAIAAKRSGIPLVWHVHEGPYFLHRLGGARVRVLRHLADRVVAVSDHVKRCLVDLGVNPERVTVVHNGIDADGYSQAAGAITREGAVAELAIPAGAAVVGMVGQLSRLKSADTFIRVASEVRKRVAGDVRFLVVGGPRRPDDSTYVDTLKALARETHVSEQLIMAGHRADAAAMMAIMDVVVVPFGSESFGFVNLEAMALSKPVVAFDSGGIPEVVAHGETGLLADPGNEVEMADMIVRLVSDPALRARMGSAGRRRVEHEFGIDRYINGVLAVYDAALGRSQALEAQS